MIHHSSTHRLLSSSFLGVPFLGAKYEPIKRNYLGAYGYLGPFGIGAGGTLLPMSAAGRSSRSRTQPMARSGLGLRALGV